MNQGLSLSAKVLVAKDCPNCKGTGMSLTTQQGESTALQQKPSRVTPVEMKCHACQGVGKIEEWIPFHDAAVFTDGHLGRDPVFDQGFSED